MSEPESSASVRHSVLADPTGCRGRRLAIAGRIATTTLGLWLVVLILGGLGLEPLGGLPIVGGLGGGEPAPPAVPERVQAAVARRTTVAVPATRVVQAPVTTVSVPSRRPAVTAPSRAKTRAPARTTPASTAPGRTTTTPGSGPASAAPAPSRPTTSPSITAPGQTRTPPGQTRTPPGQTKTGPGPPTSTPGTTPAGNGNGNGKGSGKGKALGAAGTVTTP